ncbi:MAG: glycosyltransferase family 4 protein [Deltaproteobacteria bacterium]
MNHSTELLIFDTHPIQYRAPVFRELSKKVPSLKVYFFNSDFDGDKWWFHEVGKAKSLAWGLELQEGYWNETLKTDSLGVWKTYQKLKQILLLEKPKAVLVYGYYLKEHWILRCLCAQLKISLIFIGETFSSNSSFIRRLMTSPLQHFFLKGVKSFISIGEKNNLFYLSKKISPEKIIPAKYCIDTHFFQKEEPQASVHRNELRNRLGIEKDDFVLLFVGRLFERKRPQDLISLHEMLLHTKNVHTVVIGSGPLEGELKSQCQQLPRLHWLGFQNQLQTRDWYYAADLLVVPSEFETWGLVVNEAFSCGLPALVSDSCGVAHDLVIHQKTGFVYPVGSIHSALESIKTVLTDRTLLKQLGINAKRQVSENYRPDQFADSICLALNQTVMSSK